jgi:hypothetical protein
MAKSDATTAAEYLESLPPERREVVAAVRQVILDHLPAGYEERMNWGVLSYEIPLSRYPETYNGQPLTYVGLAAQKYYYALYLTCVYQDPRQLARLEEAVARAGKKLDMGKSCVRFKRLDALPLAAIGEIVASTTPDDYIARYEAARSRQ